MNHICLCLPSRSWSGTHLPTLEGWKAELANTSIANSKRAHVVQHPTRQITLSKTCSPGFPTLCFSKLIGTFTLGLQMLSITGHVD